MYPVLENVDGSLASKEGRPTFACKSKNADRQDWYISSFSYQEEDLAKLREKWSEALDKRRQYLDEQLQKIMNKEGMGTKSDICPCHIVIRLIGLMNLTLPQSGQINKW